MRKLLIPLLFALPIIGAAGAAAAQTDPHAGHAGHTAQADAPAQVRTTPADGWMGATAPTAFSLVFPHPMRMTALSLQSGDAPAVAVAVADAAPGASISLPLPALPKGDHVLTWSAQGTDGHVMSGVVRYMVH